MSSTASTEAFPIVDVHTHVYPPSYIDLLRSRSTVPYVHDPGAGKDLRLIILPSDDNEDVPKSQRGRPVDATYTSPDLKLSFMKKHRITTSILSLANPWLDFLPAADAAHWAQQINDELEEICHSHRDHDVAAEYPPFFAFGALPLTALEPDIIVREITRLKTLKHMKGVIMGTSGLGQGLDDAALDPIWAALQDTQTILFLHPHYGLPAEAFGGDAVTERYGHVLPLALGFPLETTIAVARMYLSRVFDRFPRLEILLAHSGGALPFLAGRIESCVAHERKFVKNGGTTEGPGRSIWTVLTENIYLDAVVYGLPGLSAAVQAAGSVDRVMFGESPPFVRYSPWFLTCVVLNSGTDHPFFPPLGDTEGEWLSVTMNRSAISSAFGENTDAAKSILGGNAVEILGLEKVAPET
jgi:predicted TIM-barrel fold metal-dependent hydrolase